MAPRGVALAVAPRVLLVVQPTTGGAARHVVDLAKGLAGRRCSVLVACPRGPLVDRLDQSGIPFAVVPMRREIRPGSDVRAVLALYRLCRRWRPDVLHAHSSKAGVLARVAGRLARVPVIVYTPHCWSFQSTVGLRRAFYIALERSAARFGDFTVAVSEKERLEALEARVSTADRIRVVPNGVAASEFHRRRPHGPPDIPLLAVGRLDEQKGMTFLLKAMSILVKRRPAARLTIVGDGPLRASLEEEAAALGLGESVRFEGEQSDVGRYLHRARVFVSSSLWEGLPYTLIEAMAARLPVVTTDVGGCAELVVDGVTGAVVPPRDPAALARSMGVLLDDEGLAAGMGAAGYTRAMLGFRADSCILGNLSVYERMMEDVRRDGGVVRSGALLAPRVAVVVLATFVSLAGVLLGAQASLGDRIAPGVRIGMARVGGLTVDEAARRIDGLAGSPVSVSLSPTAPPVTVDPSILDLDVANALFEAQQCGRVGSFVSRIGERVRAARGDVTVPLRVLRDEQFEALLEAATMARARPGRDAGFVFAGGALRASPGVPATSVDATGLSVALGLAVTESDPDARVVSVPVDVRDDGPRQVTFERLYPLALDWTGAPVAIEGALRPLAMTREQLASLVEIRDERLAISPGRLQRLLVRLGVCDTRPRDARIVLAGGRVRIVDGASGSAMDATGSASALEASLSSGDRRFRPVMRAVEPNVTRDDLIGLGIVRQLSSFTTRFRPGQDGRDVNISLAAAAIRGRVLGPGEVFSLNDATGPRDRSKGYREALVFLNGKVVPGVGGGVCQVSSTAYQAALRAGLRIVERQSHSMAVGYLEPGLDATTYYPTIDLKFQNTTGRPVLLWSEVRGDRLTVTVHGSGAPRDIRIVTKVRETLRARTRTVQDARLRHNVTVVDSVGSPGYTVASYRLVYENGRLVSRESLAIDEYRPRERVVRVGR